MMLLSIHFLKALLALPNVFNRREQHVVTARFFHVMPSHLKLPQSMNGFLRIREIKQTLLRVFVQML